MWILQSNFLTSHFWTWCSNTGWPHNSSGSWKKFIFQTHWAISIQLQAHLWERNCYFSLVDNLRRENERGSISLLILLDLSSGSQYNWPQYLSATPVGNGYTWENLAMVLPFLVNQISESSAGGLLLQLSPPQSPARPMVIDGWMEPGGGGQSQGCSVRSPRARKAEEEAEQSLRWAQKLLVTDPMLSWQPRYPGQPFSGMLER